MNFSLALASNRLGKGVTVDWLTQLGAVPLLPDEQERQIVNLLLHGQVAEKNRELIAQQLTGAPSATAATAGDSQAGGYLAGPPGRGSRCSAHCRLVIWVARLSTSIDALVHNNINL
jgi:hypothetical protein